MRAEADPPPHIEEIVLHEMKRKHVRDVLDIERQVYPRPWSAGLFFSEITQRKTRHYIVAMHERSVVGYGGVMVHADEAHVTTIAVDPAFHHRGIGARVMLDLVDHARAENAQTLALEVRVANWPAQRLYAWFGFRPVGVRKNYYAETGEDALVMWIEDIHAPDITERVHKIRRSVGA